MATHLSVLAWRIPWRVWQATVHVVTRIGHDLATKPVNHHPYSQLPLWYFALDFLPQISDLSKMEFVISPNTQNLLLVKETFYNFCSNPLSVILLFVLKSYFFFIVSILNTVNQAFFWLVLLSFIFFSHLTLLTFYIWLL